MNKMYYEQAKPTLACILRRPIFYSIPIIILVVFLSFLDLIVSLICV